MKMAVSASALYVVVIENNQRERIQNYTIVFEYSDTYETCASVKYTSFHESKMVRKYTTF